MKNILIIIALIVIGAINIFAQKQLSQSDNYEGQYYPIAFNVSFLAGIPQGEFEKNNNKTGLGIGLNIFYNVENTPIYIGGKFGWMQFASDTRQSPWSTTIPDVFVDVTTSYQMYVTDFALKVMPDWGPIRPYVEFMAGFNNQSTTTTVEDINRYDEYDDIATSTDLSDWTYNYGVGGGIAFNVYRGKVEGEKSRFWELLIDINGEYLYGGTAEYATSKENMDNNFELVTAKSKTDLLSIKMGVTFRF